MMSVHVFLDLWIMLRFLKQDGLRTAFETISVKCVVSILELVLLRYRYVSDFCSFSTVNSICFIVRAFDGCDL